MTCRSLGPCSCRVYLRCGHDCASCGHWSWRTFDHSRQTRNGMVSLLEKKENAKTLIIQFHISVSNSLLRRVTDDDGILVFNEKTLSFSLSLLHLL